MSRAALACAACLAAGFGAGYYFGRPAPGAPLPAARRLKGSSKLTHPLLDCEPGDSALQDVAPAKRSLQAIVDKALASRRATHVSVYYRDLDAGPWFGIDPEARFAPASLLKVPILLAYLRHSQDDPGLLGRRVRFARSAELKYPQLFRPSVDLREGREYSIDEYLKAMIARSDNQAAVTLLKAMDPAALAAAYQDLGLQAPDQSTPEDWITVHDYAGFFRVLYNASYLDRQRSEAALALLASSEFKEGLLAGVPSGTTVAHKFGERLDPDRPIKQIHDCGIVYHPANPYLLCVMTQGLDAKALVGVIGEISAATWADITRQTARAK